MQKRFTVLRVVSTIFKVLAWIVLVIGVLSACGLIVFGAMAGSSAGSSNTFGNNPLGLGAGGAIGGAFAGIGLLVACLFYFLILYSWGDLITLLISLEENTRATAEHLLALPLPSVSRPLPPVQPAGSQFPPTPPPSNQLPPAP